jgi:hypothetical protein
MKKIVLLAVLAVVIVFGVDAQIPSYVPSNGLVAWYPFNGNANDESGNGNHGTVNGATLTSDRLGNVGKAYSFNTAPNYIQLNEISSQLGMPDKSATYSMWFKGNSDLNSRSTGQILSTYPSPQSPCCDYSIRFEVVNNVDYPGPHKKVYYRCPDENNEPVSFSSYDLNTWHSIIVVVDAINGRYNYYFDGILDSQMSFNFNPAFNYFTPRVWQIGAFYPSPITSPAPHQFYGKIDDIAIWTRALTPQEITALYTGSAPCQPTSSTTNISIPSTSLPYNWNGLMFNNAGAQTATLTNAAGCDSSATLNLIVTNTLPNYLPTNGLVGYWPFNGNANDESGNGNNGTVNGATLTSDRLGNVGSSYSFDGTNSFIQILNSNSLNFTEGTINLWFNTSQSNFMSLIERTIYTNATNENWAMGINETSSGDFTLYTKHNSNCQPGIGWQSNTTNQPLSINNWHMITGVIKSSVTEIYIEGILVQTFNTPSIIDVCGGDIQIGRHWSYDPRYFNGSLDDIAIYNRALTPQEIASLYSGCTSTDSSSFSASACNQYTLPWGDSVTQSGTYVHTYTNNAGCDSVVTAQIIINTASDSTQGETVNGNGTYTLPSGNVATQSGYYTHTYSNQYGCDSVVNFYVVINQSNVGINVSQPQRSLHVRDVIRLEPRNTPPNNPTKGDMYFDGTTDKLRIYDGRAWRDAY